MVEHNPVIAKYKMENNSLRAEIKRLTSGQSVDNINTEASAELDREYRELITQQEANGKLSLEAEHIETSVIKLLIICTIVQCICLLKSPTITERVISLI